MADEKAEQAARDFDRAMAEIDKGRSQPSTLRESRQETDRLFGRPVTRPPVRPTTRGGTRG